MLKNAKHEAFAQAVALGASAAEAYRQCIASEKTSQSTVETNGPELARSTQVALRIEELKAKNAEKAEKKFDLSRDAWLRRMMGVADKAEKSEDFAAARAALTEVGKASDYYAPEKHKLEVIVTIGGDAESTGDD